MGLLGGSRVPVHMNMLENGQVQGKWKAIFKHYIWKELQTRKKLQN